MDALLNWLWQGSLVALALTGLLRLLDRAAASVRYTVCWAALLLVMALPLLPWLARAATPSAAFAVPAAPAIVSVPYGWWTSVLVLGLAWGAWTIACAVRLGRAMAALRRARARSRRFPAAVEASLSHWCRLRDGGRRPALVLSDAITSAAVLGGRVPMIAVAPSLVASLEADELDRVVVHEWAHVQRRDDLVSVLQVVLHMLAGWHPAAWLIERRLHVEREMACDEMAVAVTGSPKSYAECLLKLATLRGGERTMLPVPAALRTSGLRARITRLMSRRVSITPAWARVIACGVVSALAVLSVAAGDQRLVAAAALALPFESVESPALTFAPLAAVRTPAVAPRPEPAVGDADAPEAVPTQEARQAPAAPPAAVPTAVADPVPLDEAPALDIAALPTEPAAIAEMTAEPGVPPAGAVDDERSPWAVTADTAADAGATIGRTSKDAGVATAGFFSRFARRVAGSF